MAFNTMIRESNTDYKERIDDDTYYYTETKSAGTNGNPVIIPTTVKKILARLVFGTGSGKIQTSVNSIAAIKAGSANWVDWDAGVVSVTTDSVCNRVNAVRIVRATGDVIMELVAY